MSEKEMAPTMLDNLGVSENELAQIENQPEGEKRIQPGMPKVARACGEEAIVLLENDGSLPFVDTDVVSVFGRVQKDYFYVGYGSGGDVHAPYQSTLLDGMRQAGISIYEPLEEIYETWCSSHPADHGIWGKWPYFHPEMPLEDEVASDAAANSTIALIVIGRAAGEDRENRLEQGSYYLTDMERAMIETVLSHFTKTVLLIDSGNVIDLSFLEEYAFSAVLFAWQLGMETGNAIGNILSGKATPSGKLTDTIARSYEDYPSAPYFGGLSYNNYTEDIYVGYRYFETFAKDAVRYPFGYGRSYTQFLIRTEQFDAAKDDAYQLRVAVKNEGTYAGKEVVQVYVAPPKGTLSKPAKVLVGFAKTSLLGPGEEETVEITFTEKDFASFDDSGVSGFAESFVLEAGVYEIFVGNSVHEGEVCASLEVVETRCIEVCASACAPVEIFDVLDSHGEKQPVYRSGRDLRERIQSRLPEEIPFTGDRGILLSDVQEGKATMEEFIAQLNDKQLSDLTHGEGDMNVSGGTAGNAGGFGGITKELRDMGVPLLVTSDGPSGLRLRRYTSLLPCGTALACTWNVDLIEEVYGILGEEATDHHVDVLLAPGMNLHRNPLCGRNFEYYAEDPLLSGRMAAACVKGLQEHGVSACPKHFACNHQEVNRNRNDSRVSERALREIYLRNFEIVIKEARPENLMTSYNLINGVWSHYNYDLITTVLRGEWGYEGNVMTDWWMQHGTSPEFPSISDGAYRVRAGVDVFMPGNWTYGVKEYVFDDAMLETLGEEDGLTRAELQQVAFHVLWFALTRMA